MDAIRKRASRTMGIVGGEEKLDRGDPAAATSSMTLGLPSYNNRRRGGSMFGSSSGRENLTREDIQLELQVFAQGPLREGFDELKQMLQDMALQGIASPPAPVIHGINLAGPPLLHARGPPPGHGPPGYVLAPGVGGPERPLLQRAPSRALFQGEDRRMLFPKSGSADGVERGVGDDFGTMSRQTSAGVGDQTERESPAERKRRTSLTAMRRGNSTVFTTFDDSGDKGIDNNADEDHGRPSKLAEQPLLTSEMMENTETEPGTPRAHEGERCWECKKLQRCVGSSTFEQVVGALVLLNAMLLGLETDYRALHPEGEPPVTIQVAELFFCSCFSVELLLRITAYGRAFFTGSSWSWNIFDLVMVCLQVLEQVSRLCSSERMNVSAMQMLRILRLARITRLIRALRLIEELRTIVSSVAKSMRSLFWSLVLLMMMVYTCSVLFTQIVTDAVVRGSSNSKALRYWFGGLSRTVLTMLETILGGVSWDEVIHLLIADVGPIAGIIFCVYVAFSIFALMNVVTGVFVEKATRTAQEDKEKYMANHIGDLFFRQSNTDYITPEVFKAHLGNSDMQEYFKAIDVDPSEAQGLFQLLDQEDEGFIYSSHFVDGLLRLRGTARALDLALLMHETRRMHQHLTSAQATLARRLDKVAKTLMGMQPGHQVELPGSYRRLGPPGAEAKATTFEDIQEDDDAALDGVLEHADAAHESI